VNGRRRRIRRRRKNQIDWVEEWVENTFLFLTIFGFSNNKILINEKLN